MWRTSPINKTERSELNRATRNRRPDSFTEGRGESRGKGTGGRRVGDLGGEGERHGKGCGSVAAVCEAACNVSHKGKGKAGALHIMKILKYFRNRYKNDEFRFDLGAYTDFASKA